MIQSGSQHFGFSDQARVSISKTFSLENLDWQIEPGARWLVLGSNGSGKSALISALMGFGDIRKGRRQLPRSFALVSSRFQAELIERETALERGDLSDQVFTGTPAGTILRELDPEEARLSFLIEGLSIGHLLDHGFRTLSTGETRKLLLARALASRAEVLLLDEPLQGLDAKAQVWLSRHLDELVGGRTLVLATNKPEQLPCTLDHVLILGIGQIENLGPLTATDLSGWLTHLQHLSAKDVPIPAPIMRTEPLPSPLVRLNQATIAYAGVPIFKGLDWTIEAGEHWQVIGPNGSGKTSLLQLILGDHPQCYVNDILVFGFQRGTGESVWDVKRNIGFVSSSLQMAHRSPGNVERTLLSGFYDSIGLYHKPSERELNQARDWLQLLGLVEDRQKPLSQLSFGSQRLVLIARAMIKGPPLLLLDEPCLGLDAANRALVLALIRQLIEQRDTAIVYVSHDESDQIEAFNRVLDLAEFVDPQRSIQLER